MSSTQTPQIITTAMTQDVSWQTPTGMDLGNSATDLLGFYGATPVAQNTQAAGNTHTPAAGATTSVYVNTTFDGGITGTNYTIGDIVTILKTVGLIKT
jgi:hypothetical protein